MQTRFEDLSQGMAETVAAAASFVLGVDARRRLPASGIAWTADGYLLTAAHVLRREEAIRVLLPDGSWVPASIAGIDPSTDLALLHAEASGLQLPQWQDEATLAVGQLVLAVGRPGRELRASLGLLSALDGAWRTPAGGQVDRYVQPDLVMYPGFSGGPLLSAGGQVIGLLSSGLTRRANLALTRSTVERVAGELREHGRMRRGYLGVTLQAARLPASLAEAAGQAGGLVLVGLEPEGPAEAGGLRLGDTLLALDGMPLAEVDDLSVALAGKAGLEATLRLSRGEAIQELALILGEA